MVRIPSPGPEPRSVPICSPTPSSPTCHECVGWKKHSRISLLRRSISGQPCFPVSRFLVGQRSTRPNASGPRERSRWPGATGDSVLIAQSLLDQNQSPTAPAALAASIVAADEVIRLAERAGRSDLALSGHQRGAGYHLNRGDLATANQSLGRAEVWRPFNPLRGVTAPCSSAPQSLRSAAAGRRPPRR
jgi:hypothetical protein